jgi:ABC-type antimicrobial peptide transport system permease subunit
MNRTFARKLYGDAPAIGQRFALWATAKYMVVGVVEDGKYQQVSEDPQPAMFIPLARGVGDVMSTSTSVVVRSQLPESQIAPALERALAGVEPGAPIIVTTWADAIDRTMVLARAGAMVLSVMGMLAAMLAITGTFGMASYSVSKRMKEQGIRMALGAGRMQVLRAILHRPVLLLFAGSVAGLLATRVLAHLISFATPRDPLVLARVLLTMMFVGVVATWIPARRALGIDPARLLRE